MPSSLLTKEWGFFVCTFYIFFSLAIVFNPSKVCRYWFWSGPQMCVSSKVLICGQYLNVEVSVSFLVQYSSGYTKARSTCIVLRAKSIVCIMCNVLHPLSKLHFVVSSVWGFNALGQDRIYCVFSLLLQKVVGWHLVIQRKGLNQQSATTLKTLNHTVFWCLPLTEEEKQ